MGARFEARHFRAPIGREVGSILAGVAFVVVGVLVALGDRGLLSSDLARVLRGNPDALGPRAFSALLVLSGLGTLVRARLAGVSVQEERIVVRGSAALGFPRVRAAYWAELRGMRVESGVLVLVQFDGSPLVLPPVADEAGLEVALRERLERYGVRAERAGAEA